METCHERNNSNRRQPGVSLVYGEGISCNSEPVSANLMRTLKYNIVYKLLACCGCFEIRNSERLGIISFPIYRIKILRVTFGVFLLGNGSLCPGTLRFTLTQHM
jgi:hypothetical protein